MALEQRKVRERENAGKQRKSSALPLGDVITFHFLITFNDVKCKSLFYKFYSRM